MTYYSFVTSSLPCRHTRPSGISYPMTQNSNSEDRSKKIGGKILAVTISLGALLCVVGIWLSFTSGSDSTNAVSSRIFDKVSIEYVGEYKLPQNSIFKDTPVGGLSGLTYDRQKDLYYAVSDDRSDNAPARFYTLVKTILAWNDIAFLIVCISDIILETTTL